MTFLSRMFGPASNPRDDRDGSVLKGDGTFTLQVVGESKYQHALEALSGGRSEEGVDSVVTAALVLEDENPYDPQAVRVEIDGHQVGHLSREDARRYRKAFVQFHGRSPLAYCRARIVGGWQREGGDLGHFGVKLDVSFPEEGTMSARPKFNADAQPFTPRMNLARRVDRDVSEMLGLVKGVLADGIVTASEASCLRDWVHRHPDSVGEWPVNALYPRLQRVFADRRIDEEERIELKELLEELVGGDAGVLAGEDAATDLPVDRPPPDIAWNGSVFVLTGKFAFGPRSACEREVAKLGGMCEPNVTKRTRYLVIGTFGSRDWVQTSFGRKIMKAVKYRSKGVPIAIVAEDHWADNLS